MDEDRDGAGMSPDDGHATGAQVAADGLHRRPATPEEAQADTATTAPATDNTAASTTGQVRTFFVYIFENNSIVLFLCFMSCFG